MDGYYATIPAAAGYGGEEPRYRCGRFCILVASALVGFMVAASPDFAPGLQLHVARLATAFPAPVRPSTLLLTAVATQPVVPEEPDWGTLGGFALQQARKQWRAEMAHLLPIPGVVVPFQSLVGSPLTTPTGETVTWDSVLGGPDAPPLVGLYFGARHCRPCKVFLAAFVKAYKAMNAKGRRIEVLYASMDFDEQQRNLYLQERPYFLGLPYELGGVLKNGWGVRGTPAVFVMDPRTGHLLSSNAKQDIEDLGSRAVDVWLQRLQQVPPPS
jgi:hypothetical protein